MALIADYNMLKVALLRGAHAQVTQGVTNGNGHMPKNILQEVSGGFKKMVNSVGRNGFNGYINAVSEAGTEATADDDPLTAWLVR